MRWFYLLIFFIFNSLFSQIHVGQRFILTLPIDTSRANLKKWLSQTKPAGIMLLYHSKFRKDTKDLITFLQDEAKNIGLPELFISIDWEGGIVSRIHEGSGFNSVPSPRNLAKSDRTYSFLAGKLIGQQCKNIGVNMNFAPLLDTFNEKNSVLATRPFSKDSEKIIDYALAFSNGLKSEGILPVFKHFPGLGLGIDDTHFEIVEINAEKKDFDKNVAPFVKALQENNPVIMATHASYPYQFGKLPTTLSKKAVEFIKDINKDALLITDDFWMGGVRKGKKLEDIVLQSFSAGYHLIILSARKGEDIDLIEKIQMNVNSFNSAEKSYFKSQIDFINSFKNKNINNFKDSNFLDEKRTAKLLAQKCIKEFYPDLDLDKRENILITIDLPKLRPSENWFIDNNGSYLKQGLAKLKIGVNEFIFDVRDKESLEKTISYILNIKLKDKNLILQTFFYGAGIGNDVQKSLLESLKNIQKNIIIISLGHPYEKNILPQAKIFNLGSFSRPMLDVVVKRLIKNKVPKNDFNIRQLLSKLKNKSFSDFKKIVSDKGLNGTVGEPCKIMSKLNSSAACLTKAIKSEGGGLSPQFSTKSDKKVGLLCHAASRFNLNNKEVFLPDFLKDRVDLKAIFSPEHGLFGNYDAAANVFSQDNSNWGCPIYSLHGQYKKPTADMLKDLDLMVVDLHEVGIRAFTYLSSLELVMQACKENNLPVLVIDHVNPIYFWSSQGPELKDGFKSFVGRVNVPFIHGQSIGKIAENLNKKIGVNLSILPILSKKYFKDYLKYNKFFAPSPNLVSLESVYSYPITVFIEGTNYSEARGTNYPFQQIGAPWVDGQKLADSLNSKKLTGVYFEPVSFNPISIEGKSLDPKHKNKLCQGVFLHFYDLKKVDPMEIAQEMLKTLFKEYPKESELIKFSGKYFLDHLVGNDSWKNSFFTQHN